MSAPDITIAKLEQLLKSQQHLIQYQENVGRREGYFKFARRLKRHLTNIRLLADRSEPNITGILVELNDIERYMSNYEKELVK